MAYPDEPLTLSLLRQVLLVSYRLSQGRGEQHSALFAAVAARRPQWRWPLSGREETALEEQLVAAMEALSQRGFHFLMWENEIRTDLRFELQNLRMHLELPVAVRSEGTPRLETISMHMLLADHTFLCEEGGRPRRSEASTSPSRSLASDPFGSQFCHYVLLGQSTGCSVFDEILAEIRAAIEGQARWWLRIQRAHKRELYELIHCHNVHHPQTPVALPHPGVRSVALAGRTAPAPGEGK